MGELKTESMTIRRIEILQLVRLSLLGKSALTQWNLSRQGDCVLTELESLVTAEGLEKIILANAISGLSLRLFFSISSGRVWYAECGGDSLDLIFSFLTFPLGFIVKLYRGNSLIGCIDNLYKSINDLSANNYVKSTEAKTMLLCPQLAPFFASKNQLIEVEEGVHLRYYLSKNSNGDSFIYPDQESGIWSIMYPMSSADETTAGGGYVRGSANFMITDDLVVMQQSSITSIQLLGKLNTNLNDGRSNCQCGQGRGSISVEGFINLKKCIN